jgi:hypothetical protein
VTTFEVQAVIPHETVIVAYCVDRDGTEVAIAVEPGMAHNLSHELEAGRRPSVLAEDWQIVVGYRRLPQLR